MLVKLYIRQAIYNVMQTYIILYMGETVETPKLILKNYYTKTILCCVILVNSFYSTMDSISKPLNTSLRSGTNGYVTIGNSVMAAKPAFIDLGLGSALERSQFYINQLTDEDYDVLAMPIRPLVPVHSRSKLQFPDSPKMKRDNGSKQSSPQAIRLAASCDGSQIGSGSNKSNHSLGDSNVSLSLDRSNFCEEQFEIENKSHAKVISDQVSNKTHMPLSPVKSPKSPIFRPNPNSLTSNDIRSVINSPKYTEVSTYMSV
jgi:hypothetical protein